MKTRAQIYGQEATGLLRIISMYPGLKAVQLCRFYSDKKDKIPAILSNLEKQGRICVNARGGYFTGREPGDGADNGLSQSVWVLLDFIERVDFHSVGEFPVKIIFFAGGEVYEVIYVEKGQEALAAHLLNQNKAESGKRIILVEEPGQIEQLTLPSVSGFCTVGEEGNVKYYKKL